MEQATVGDIEVSSNTETAAAMLANFATETPAEPATPDPVVAEPKPDAPPVEAKTLPVEEPPVVDPDEIADRRADGTFKSNKEIRDEFNKRLKKQTFQIREAERKLEALSKAPVTPAQPAAVPPSTAAAFAFPAWEAYAEKHPDAAYNDYILALTDARVEHTLTAERARIERESASHAALQTLQRLTDLGRKAHADFDAVMTTALEAGAAFSPLLTESILADDDGHRLAYLLAKDLTQLQQLSAITQPGILARKLAPLMATLTAVPGSVAPPVPITKATPPIHPVGSASVAADPNAFTGEESVDEYIRKVNAQARIKARLR